jgi:predicted metal-dependent peptidase
MLSDALRSWGDEISEETLRVLASRTLTKTHASGFYRSTFGVVLDTSGSMDSRLLGKALGAIASYALARDVPAARVVFCDAAAYDAGYLPVAEIAGRVRVRGRGGTVLQPGVNLLERAPDFPATAPILVITDGACDVLRVRREHAYLVPDAARLPFTPRGPVFRVR